MADKRDIQKRITSIRNRGAKMDRDIHETAVLCLTHASEHGDITLLSKLAEAMPKSTRRKALIAWAVAHAPITFSEKQEQFKLKKKRNESDWHIEEADAVPFWDYTKEKKPAQYDLSKAVNGLVRTIRKANEQGNLKAGRDTAEAQIREALNTLEAEGTLS